ncbi:hypothetical protein BDF20DRAFT_843867 [Mycotypha africana]|uniref:uncharacterized protein n=1 Tax=Mycotypha africana TaxID=64632 RepID=UPI0023003516|nr:uncharacterized protein BDF20DRAFT_843867 [Mycotypha africana]KAI8991296.1 hypothetical protein BDF20DRAFT_843867 [Mycotypha africana]
MTITTDINDCSPEDVLKLSDSSVNDSGTNIPVQYHLSEQQAIQDHYNASNINSTTISLDDKLSETSSEHQIATTLSSSSMTDYINCSINSGNPNLTSCSVPISAQQVQSLVNELKHTKQLLRQYQARTEYLMDLVGKQTNKISELRDQIATKQNRKL